MTGLMSMKQSIINSVWRESYHIRIQLFMGGDSLLYWRDHVGDDDDDDDDSDDEE